MKGIHINSTLEWVSMMVLCQPKSSENSPYGPYFFHQFDCWKEPAVVYYSGFSKTKAAGAAQYMISRFNLEQIVVAGTSGGVAKHLEPLDVVVANETVIYDCIDRLELETALFPEHFKTAVDLSWLKTENLPEKSYIGRVATADQDIDYSVRALLEPEEVLVADWESGAIAMICQLNQIPVTIFRGVSDLPTDGLSQEEQAEQYKTNTPKLMKRIVEQYLPLVP